MQFKDEASAKLWVGGDQMNTTEITLPEKYSVFRDGLLVESRGIAAVVDAKTQDHAAIMGREIQNHLKEVEEARQSLTAPLLAAQRKLMELKEAHCAPLEAEKKRLGELVSAFQLAQAQRVLEEERQRNAEIMRLEDEKQAAREALEKALANFENAPALANRIPLEIAIDQAKENFTQVEAQSYAAIVAPLPEPVKAVGASTKMKLCHEVTDIHALYKARPDLCEIKVKPSAVNAVCKVTDKIPGLKLWEIPTTSFRR